MSMGIIILQKSFGVGITDFSIGFGKELFGFNDKSGNKMEILFNSSWWIR